MTTTRRSRKPLANSALVYVLKGLIPYTDANLKLSFAPGVFFRELARVERKAQAAQNAPGGKAHSPLSLRNAFYRAKKQGLVEVGDNGVPRLTREGWKRIKPYRPEKLMGSVRLMVIFDIPEEERHKRRHIRMLLKELHFEKEQKSVWTTAYDCRDYLQDEIKTLGLQNYIRIYECARIT